MGLFLLTIPLAIASGVILKKDIKYTTLAIKIPDAKFELNEQIKQIDNFLFDIFEYVGVEGDIDRNKQQITNTKYNGYNGLKIFLGEKGYRKEAIDYAVDRYNSIATNEFTFNTNEREERINNFESKVKYENTHYEIYRTNILEKHTKQQAEYKVQQLLRYFKTHGQKDIYCNIIMDGSASYHNHTEVWHMKKPYNATYSEFEQYFQDIYDKIIGDD